MLLNALSVSGEAYIKRVTSDKVHVQNPFPNVPVISESSVPVWGCICLDLMWFVLLFEFRFQTSHTALRQMRFFSPAEPQYLIN